MAGQQAGNPNTRSPGRYSNLRGIIDDSTKVLAGDAGMVAGWIPGVARGAWHTMEDVWGLGKSAVNAGIEAGQVAGRLANPNAATRRAAWNDVYGASKHAVRSGKSIVGYVNNAVHNPKVVLDDVKNGVHSVEDGLRRYRVKVDPTASPVADTPWGELSRNFKIGMNQGEAAFDVGSAVYGGAELKALTELARMSKAGKAAKMAEDVARFQGRGYPENLSRYFAEPYHGMGHHFFPRAKKLPEFLGGKPLPKVISDSPFNVLKPRAINRGDMFELHFGVDPSYRGGRIRKEFGGGRWSGDELGWTKLDRAGRLWYGSPKPLKAVAGAAVFGSAGALADQYYPGHE